MCNEPMPLALEQSRIKKLTIFVGKYISLLIFNPVYVDLIQIEVRLFRTDHLYFYLIKLHFKMLTLFKIKNSPETMMMYIT